MAEIINQACPACGYPLDDALYDETKHKICPECGTKSNTHQLRQKPWFVDNRWKQLLVCTVPPILWSVLVLLIRWRAEIDTKITEDLIGVSLLWMPVAAGVITQRRINYLQPQRTRLVWLGSFAGLFAESLGCLLILACWVLIPLIVVIEVL